MKTSTTRLLSTKARKITHISNNNKINIETPRITFINNILKINSFNIIQAKILITPANKDQALRRRDSGFLTVDLLVMSLNSRIVTHKPQKIFLATS